MFAFFRRCCSFKPIDVQTMESNGIDRIDKNEIADDSTPTAENSNFSNSIESK